MYKLILLLVAGFHIQPGFAQVKLGIKTGGAITNLYAGMSGFTTQPGTGVLIGGFMQNTRYQSKFFTRIEAAYSLAQFHIRSANATLSFNVSSFILPLAFGFQPAKHWYVLAGIQPTVRIHQTKQHVFGNFAGTDIVMLAGVGYQINQRWGVELRATNGVLPLLSTELTDANGVVTKQSGMYQQSLQLSASYNFAIEELSSIRPVLRRH